MALKKQNIPVDLGSSGMDSSTDPKVNSGNIQVMNANYDVNGIITKREGSEESAQLNDQNTNLANYKDNVIAYGKDLYSWNGEELNEITDRLGILDVGRFDINNKNRNISFHADYAELDNIYAISYATVDVLSSASDEYGLYLETFSKSTNQQIDLLELQAPLVGEKKFAKLIKTADDNIQYYWIDTDGYVESGGIDDSGNIEASSDISGLNVGRTEYQSFDACFLENDGIDGYVVLAYPGPNSRARLATLENGTTVSYQTDQTMSGDIIFCSCWRQTATTFGHTYTDYRHDSTATRTNFRPRNITLNYNKTDVGAFILTDTAYQYRNVTGVALTDTSARIYGTWMRVPDSRRTDWIPEIRYTDVEWESGNTTLETTDTLAMQLAQVATKPIRFADNDHVVGAYFRSWGTSLTAQDQLFWLNADGYTVGRSLIGIARMDEYGVSAQYDAYSTLPQIQQTDDDGYKGATIFPWIRRLSVDDTQQQDKFQLARLELDWMPDGNASAETPKTLILANSMPYEYDGTRVSEAGFPAYPEKLYADPDSGIGAMDPSAVYKYVALYEEVGPNGVLHRSSPTPTPVTVTMGASDNGVFLQVPVLPGRRENSYTAFYRTVDGGTEYYRVKSLKHKDYPELSHVQVSDGLSDDDLTDNEPLYTDSGELENLCARPHRVSTVWQNRYVYADRDNESTRLFYSKLFSPDFAVGFNDALSFNVNNDGGRITALFSFSNKLIIFKQRMIYATSGYGYDNIGSGSNFQEPWLISPSVGCIDQRSLVRTPNGVMFQSERGIWLLTQNEQLVPIGEPVQEQTYDNDYKIVGTGTIHNRHEAIFIPDDGYALSFNWMKNKWSLITDRDGTAGISNGNTQLWIDNDHVLNSTVQNSYADNDEFYQLRVDTGWFSFANLGGHKRVWKFLIIGQNIDDHKLRVKVAYDFDPYWVDDEIYEATALTSFGIDKYYDAGLGSSGEDQAYVIEVPTSRQKCNSIKISIEDQDSGSGASQGLAITAVVFETGAKAGTAQVGDTKVVGG